MNKKYLLLCILLDVLAISLIPLNLLLFDMPEFLSIVLTFLLILATVLFFLKGNSKKKSKTLVCTLTIISIVISLFGSYCFPYWNSISMRKNVNYSSKPYDSILTSTEAQKDLDYAMKYLKKLHPSCYDGAPEAITLQYEKVKCELNLCDTISVNELSRKIESIFSLLEDGHTYVTGNYDDRRIMKYYRQWLNEGYTITAVNGISIEQLLAEHSPYYSFEATAWEYEWLSDDIVTVAGIDYLGFDIANGVEYTLTSQTGQTRTEVCFLEDYLVWEEYAEFNHLDDTDNEEENFVSYEIEQENNLAILSLDSCNYNDEYINCVHDMFQEVKNLNIKNIAVDLRNNGGGSSFVVTEFFKYLDIDSYKTVSTSWRLGFFYLNLGNGVTPNDKYQDLLFDGNLYLLTSAGTFSSAMMFAEYVKDNKLGTIIGEAPGNNPNGCGEISCFKLPNSELFMQISTKRFYRADKNCTDKLVTPDIACERDDAVEELYKCIRGE